MPQWTQAQRDAIEARGSNLLVAAAAGSGKTAVLVERIMSLLKEGIPLRSMLMVTFTRAAAAEMRGRIFAALQDAADKGDQQLAPQMAWVDHADILTLHGFCTRVLRSHFQAADVDPAFRVAEPEQVRPLQQQAMEEALIECCEEAPEAMAALTESLDADEMADWAQQLYRFLMARPDPWHWLETAIRSLPTQPDQIEGSSLVQSLLRDFELDAQAAALRAGQLAAACRRDAAWERYEATALQDEAVCRSFAQAARQGLGALRDLCVADGSPWPRLPTAKRGDVAAKEASERFKKRREPIKKQVEALRKDFFPGQSNAEYAEDCLLLQRQLEALSLVLHRYDQLYTLLKEERNLLDFSDLEQRALLALADPHIADALAQHYACIFVDEYQDSSPLQEALLERIARDNNRFMVGDVKQSIYRFRQADPTLFLDKYQRYGQEAGARDRKIELNKNFRSCPDLLHGVNRIFSRIMRASVTEIEYDDAAALHPGLPAGEAQPAVELHLIDPGGEAEHETAQDVQEEEDAQQALEAEAGSLMAIEQEAVWIAQRILELLGKPAGSSGTPLRFRDMVILLRAPRGRAARMIEILRAYGIRAWTDQGDNFYEQLEVAQILDLLRVLDNPLQDGPLLAALRGPALGLQEEALSSIRIQMPTGSFATAVAHAAEQEDALGEALRGFYQRIEKWRGMSKFCELSALIYTIYEETDFLALVGALPGGRGRQANLRLLAETAARFEANMMGGLSPFLRHVDHVRQHEDTAAAQDIGPSDDFVRIMSIHKSKGLQFPVVFLAGLGIKFHRPEAKQPVLCHSKLGVGAWAYDAALGTRRETLAFRAIVQALQREQLAEEARVLYVGMTRAEQYLLMYASVKQLTDAVAGWDHVHHDASIAKASTPLDWIMPCLLNHPQAAGFRDAVGLEPCEQLEDDDSKWDFHLHAAPKVPEAQGKADPATFMAALKAYPVDEAARMRLLETVPVPVVPFKQSVTERLRDGRIDLSPIAAMPLCLQDEAATLSGAERGTALHKLLSQLDLDTLRHTDELDAALQEQRDRAVELGVISPAEAQVISIAAMARFYGSPLGKRLLTAPRVEREFPFNLRSEYQGETVLLQGVIDCCFLEDGGWVLIDFKTDQDNDLDATLLHYQPQLAYYAQALESITHRPVHERLLYMFSRHQAFAL